MTNQSDQNNKNKSIYKRLLTGLIILILTLSVVRVVLADVLATSGQRLAAENQKIKMLEEQNQKLENETSSLNSLARVEETAKKTGLVKAENVEVLVPALPVASR